METWKIIIICLSCILIAAGISAAVVIFTNKKSSDDTTSDDTTITVRYDVNYHNFNHNNYYQHYKLTSQDNVKDRREVLHTDSNDPDITVWVGDTIEFVTNFSYPMRILRDTGMGKIGNQQSGHTLNDGSEILSDGIVTFTPKTAGTYYYQSSYHTNMHGKIMVDPINTYYNSHD